MSKISLVYDAWITLVQTALPDYYRITNSLDISENPSLLMQKGWALLPSVGENTERVICGNKSYKRSFEIILVNQVTITENNHEFWDILTKEIHEDVATLFSAVENSSVLNDMTNGLGVSKMLSDAGLEFVGEGDKSKFFQVALQVETEYFEPI